MGNGGGGGKAVGQNQTVRMHKNSCNQKVLRTRFERFLIESKYCFKYLLVFAGGGIAYSLRVVSYVEKVN